MQWNAPQHVKQPCKKIIVLKYNFKFVAVWNNSLIQNKLRYAACLQIIRFWPINQEVK